MRARDASDNKTPENDQGLQRRGRETSRVNVRDYLREDRNALKHKLVRIFDRILSENRVDANTDLVALLHNYMGLLPLALAKGILCKQATDDLWHALLEASKGRIGATQARAVQPGRRCSFGNRVSPGPSRLANELVLVENNIAANGLHTRSDSDSSTETTSSEGTLVDEEDTRKLTVSVKKFAKTDGFVVRNVQVQRVIPVAGTPITAHSTTVEYTLVEESNPEVGVEIQHAPSTPRNEGGHHVLTRTVARRPHKRSARA